MKDLTPTLRRAVYRTDIWSTDIASHVLSSLATAIPGSTVDWEQGDEQWGRVVRSGDVVGYVHAAWPLVIILSALEECVNQLSLALQCEVIVTADFADKVFCVEKTFLECMCARAVSDNIDYRRLSINDLWWATI